MTQRAADTRNQKIPTADSGAAGKGFTLEQHRGALDAGNAPQPQSTRELLRQHPERVGRIHKQASPKAREPESSTLPLTDLGNARRIVRDHGENLCYVPQLGKWFSWDQMWELDDSGHVERCTKTSVENIRTEAMLTSNQKERRALLKWQKTSENAGRIAAMITLAQSEAELVVHVADLDQHPKLLNCRNGTLDLQTFELRPHRRKDLLTQKIPVSYDPTAECPEWLKFLGRVLGGSDEVMRFVQRAVGYSLTGEMTAQCFFLLYGGGQNGKSTFLNTLREMFGDYGYPAAFHTFLHQQHGEMRNDLAALRGKRFVTAIEAESGERLSESVIKSITGGDPITARYLHREYFSYIPQCKIWMGVNDKPTIRSTGRGIWRRLHPIAFTVEIPDTEVDQELPEKLRREWPGILRWALEGCRQWRAAKLAPPLEVQKAKAEYREEMDVLGPFISECCEVGPDYKITAAAIYQKYKSHCDRNGEKPWAQRTFGLALKQRGFKPDKDGDGTRYWRGVRAREEAELG